MLTFRRTVVVVTSLHLDGPGTKELVYTEISLRIAVTRTTVLSGKAND